MVPARFYLRSVVPVFFSFSVVTVVQPSKLNGKSRRAEVSSCITMPFKVPPCRLAIFISYCKARQVLSTVEK